MSLRDVIAGNRAPSASEIVRRPGVVAPLVTAIVLSGVGALIAVSLADGSWSPRRGKDMLGLVAFPFLVLWALWIAFASFRRRRRGHASYAVSATELLYVEESGEEHLFPLAVIQAIELDKEGMPTLTMHGDVAGEPVKLYFSMAALSGDSVTRLLTRPASGKRFVADVSPRLLAVNPSATIELVAP